MASPLRVIVWATGGIGSIAIRAIKRRPDFELVGVWVHSPDKAGRDVGEILGGPPMGIIATNDAAELVGLKPDCVVYTAGPPGRDADTIGDYTRLLSSGINVVSTSATNAVYPPAYIPHYRELIVEAARSGDASFYASGIEPGFAADHLVLMLATQSSTIASIHACEFGLYDDYPVAPVMMDGMGFGRPLDFNSALAQPGAILNSWAGSVRMIAGALGFELEDLRERYERLPTPRDLDVACGRLEAGTCGAIRIQAIGIVEGQEAIVIEHVTRMAPDLAPEWPSGSQDVAYRIEIAGTPDIRCDMSHGLADPAAQGIGGMAAGAGAMVATAMRVVNAIPHVVAADAGFLGALDLPLTTPRHSFAKKA